MFLISVDMFAFVVSEQMTYLVNADTFHIFVAQQGVTR